MTRRLEEFVADEGTLARFLHDYVGDGQSVLSQTLAQRLGEGSELFKKLSPTEKDGLVQILESRLGEVMQANQRELSKALDPLAKDGAVARMLRSLREELESADKDRATQLQKAIAALDANDENSLMSRLVRETG